MYCTMYVSCVLVYMYMRQLVIVCYLHVQRETRRVYTLLMGEDIENFDGWKIEPGWVYVFCFYACCLHIQYMYTYTHSLCTHTSNKGGRLIINSREIGKGFKSEGAFHLQKYFEGVNVSLTATYKKKHSFTHLFILRVTYNDPANQRILNRLLQVKALNPEFLTQHVKGNVLADMYCSTGD